MVLWACAHVEKSSHADYRRDPPPPSRAPFLWRERSPHAHVVIQVVRGGKERHAQHAAQQQHPQQAEALRGRTQAHATKEDTVTHSLQPQKLQPVCLFSSPFVCFLPLLPWACRPPLFESLATATDTFKSAPALPRPTRARVSEETGPRAAAEERRRSAELQRSSVRARVSAHSSGPPPRGGPHDRWSQNVDPGAPRPLGKQRHPFPLLP